MTTVLNNFSSELMRYLQYEELEKFKKYLINIDCPRKLVDKKGANLLHHAATYGDGRIARYLLGLGFLVDYPDYEGYTPLTYAVQTLNDSTAELLIRHGANIYNETRYESGMTLLQTALCSFSVRIIKLFIYELRRDYLTNENLAAVLHVNLVETLHPVMYLRNAEVTRLLIEKGHSPSDTYALGNTCLNLAVELSDFDSVRLLIDHGVDVNERSPSGHFAVDSIHTFNNPRNLEIIKLLIDNGADFSRSWSCINKIFQHGTREMVRLLVQTHRDFIMKNIPELLLFLASNNNEAVIHEIEGISFNEINACAYLGRTPLDYAVLNGHLSAVEFLLKNGTDLNFMSDRRKSMSMSYVFQSNYSIKSKMQRLKLLLEYGADPEHMFRPPNDNRPTTPLEYVVLKEELQLAKPLLAHIVLRARLQQHTTSSKTLKVIEEEHCLKNYFQLCKRQLEIMEKTKIRASVTLLDLLIKDVAWVACHVKNQNFVSELTCVCKKYKLNPYYRSMLLKRSTEILTIVNVMQEVSRIYDDIFGHLYQRNDLIIDKIINFMSWDNLQKVLQAQA